MGRTKKFWNEVVASGVCLAVLFCIPLPLLADTPKAINDQTATGDRPFANFMSADIDQVQINSGALDVRIPLVYRKGRRLDFDPFWLYTNKVWMVQAIPTGLPRPNDYQRFWTTVDQQEVTFVLEERTCGAVGPYNVATKFVYTDRFGTKHPFDGQKAYAVQACDLDQLTGHSLDATGMTLTIPSNFDPAGGSASLVREKDGTQVNVNSAVGVWREDSNGNFISISSLSQSETDRVDTLGRTVRTVTGQLADGTKYNDWIVRDSNGVVQTTRVEFIDVAVQTNFQLPQVSEYFGSLFGLAKRIILPNGLTYRFTYDGGAYGDLLRVDLPTGGYIRYEHQTILADRSTSRGVAKRIVSVDGNPTNEKTWTYGPHLGNGLPGQFTITVTDPDGNDSVHTFLDFVNNSSYEIKVQFYQGSASAGTLLKTVQTDYTSTQFPIADVRPIRVTTTLPNGLTSKVETDYDSAPDSNGVIAGSRANPSERREYTYGSGAAGPLARRTTFTYLHNSNSAYANANLVSLVSNQITYDGSGSLVAQTSFGYDTTPIAITSGVVQHDYTNYPYTNTVRGNRTTISRWRNTDGAWLTTTNWFDDLGNLKQTQDPLTHNTFIDYTDSWGTQSGASACAPSGGSAQAFVTKITNHLGQIARSSYYSCSSRGATTTDLNSQTTTFSYDLMDRRTQVNLPDGGQTSVCYSEIQGSSCYSAPPPLKVVTTTKVDSTKNLVAAAVYDGLGRVSQAQLNSDPQGITYTDTTYDNLGRKATVSNPYRSTGDPTYGITTYQYDALGRTTKVIPPDGTGNNNYVLTEYCGNATKVTEQAGKWRRSITDALGRLVEVDEPNSPSATVNVCPGTGEPIAITSYSYDTLGNLTQVVQSASRQRTFVYNSLSQLASSTNPETGAVSYTYDNDGNLLTKADARSITITYAYDGLHRLTGRSYSNGDPSVSYFYDQTTYNGLTIANGIGRRTGMSDAVGAEAWSYEVMGRELADRRTTNGVTKTTSYTYNLAGSLATLTYPSGRVVTYAYDAASRPLSAVDQVNTINYALSATYAPQGALASLVLGSSGSFAGINLNESFNSRLQPSNIKAWSTTSTALDLTYSFVDASSHNNGNVVSIANNRDTNRSQSFSYDQLSRITSAQTQGTTGPNCWGLSFSYDIWANLTAASVTQCSAPMLSLTVNSNNRITNTGFSYDITGNMTGDGSFSYTWNAESQIKAAAGVTYSYDGDGNRVQKSNGKLYWYGVGSEVLDESDLAGNITDEYVLFGGKRIARRDSSGNIYYYMEDFLGSSRVITQANGTLCYDADFYPYGGERAITNTCPQNYKFTGKERDAETGLDDFGARFYSSGLGRWLSPDWSSIPVPVPYADLTNPQTLNLYQFVRNNPETFVDLDGHDPAARNSSRGIETTIPPCSDAMGGPGCPGVGSSEPQTQQEQQQGQGSTVPPSPPPPKPPENALQRTEYSTVDAAGRAAETRMLDTSLQQRIEYGARIYKNPDGTYSSTAPRTDGSPTSVTLPPVSSLPPGTQNAGRAHTHPNVPGYDHEHFSPADKRNARNEHVPSYIGTANHRLKKYDPSAPINHRIKTFPGLVP